MLRTFKEYRAQPDFGCRVDHEFDAWLIAPVGHHRDSDTLDETNWEVQVEAMKAAEPEDGDDYRIHRFDHWAVGWVEILIVRPGSKCETVAWRLAERLENYPSLDDEKLYEREYNDYLTGWDEYGAADFVRGLKEQFALDNWAVGDLLDDADRDQLREFFEELLPSGEYYIPEGSGVSIQAHRAAGNCTVKELAAFVRKLRAGVKN